MSYFLDVYDKVASQNKEFKNPVCNEWNDYKEEIFRNVDLYT